MGVGFCAAGAEFVGFIRDVSVLSVLIGGFFDVRCWFGK